MKTHVIIINGALTGMVGVIDQQDGNVFTIRSISSGKSFKFGRMDYLIATPHQILHAYTNKAKIVKSELLTPNVLVQHFDTGVYLTIGTHNSDLTDSLTHERITEI